MPRRRRSPSSSPSRERGDRRRYKDRRRSRSRSDSRRRRSRSRSDSPPRRRRSRSRSRERSRDLKGQPLAPGREEEQEEEGELHEARTQSVDPMAALEATAAPGSAPDPMAALEAAAVKAVPPPSSAPGSSGPATPFDFFEAFQRARPDQAAPRCKATASTAASTSALEPASAGRPSEEGSMQSLPAEEATTDAVEQAHQDLDPLARLLVRQSRQVHVRVPRQATAASDDAQPRAEGRRGQPARFAPQYDTVDRAADVVPQD